MRLSRCDGTNGDGERAYETLKDRRVSSLQAKGEDGLPGEAVEVVEHTCTCTSLEPRWMEWNGMDGMKDEWNTTRRAWKEAKL